MTQAAAGALDPVAIQRRTVRTLVASQALGAIGITIGIATASLLARDISGSEAQSGLAQTCQVLGAAVASYLLARLMSRRGRRVGLVIGYLLGAAGGVLAVVAGVVGSMPLLLVGAVLLGATTCGQLRVPVRRHRPGPRAHTGPGPSRSWCGPPPSAPCRAQPHRRIGVGGRRARAARAHRSVRHRHRRPCWPRRWCWPSRCAPTRCSPRAGWRTCRSSGTRRGGGPSRSSASSRCWRPRWSWWPVRTPR